MQTKRTIFPNKLLPYALLAPQLAVTLICFIWPAAQAVKSSFEREDPFGFRNPFIWFENYTRLFSETGYLNSLTKTAIFAVSVTLLSMSLALLLAVAVIMQLRHVALVQWFQVLPLFHLAHLALFLLAMIHSNRTLVARYMHSVMHCQILGIKWVSFCLLWTV